MLRKFVNYSSASRAQIHHISRSYARSRFPEGDSVGFGRAGRARRLPTQPLHQHAKSSRREQSPSADESSLWSESRRTPSSDPEEGLHRLLGEDILVVTRQIEMLSIFAGFEQANRYAIANMNGETLGYIAEESRSILSTVSRQMFRTHRPFRAVIMDQGGTPVLWLRRPFSWINSRMYVQRLHNYHDYTRDGEPVLDTFAEVQQVWHPWRRCYDLFLKDTPRRMLTLANEPQPEPGADVIGDEFVQFAKIDQGFLAWDFFLRDVADDQFALVSKKFRGFGREVFTDTSQYFVHFRLPGDYAITPDGQFRLTNAAKARPLSLEQRAVSFLVNIDFDYFSRHSGGCVMYGFPFFLSTLIRWPS
ncbi:Scramblase-domain-containing protein [Vararia minispora EC-137]|uniref:Scramblase-domain-containing protein n=1 Tax=Vararia minispora EC-137 TaxID=1314806 RepID=A0ACB8QUY5_9AGAM|nr:Scramblase-domain-containing protein [Vararia minispora EC-137]